MLALQVAGNIRFRVCLVSQKIIIIGASHAAIAVADDLRKRGFDGLITMLSAESALPYQRPPLSKAYMSGDMSLERLHLRPAQWYDDNEIDLKLDHRVINIDRANKAVSCQNGAVFNYDNLVIATGADARRLPADAGGALSNVFTMRYLQDADQLMARMTTGQRLVVIGGGYIGLEAAAEAAKKGLVVTVIEAAERILRRVACRETADAFRAIHESHGVKIIEGTQILGIVEGDNKSARAVQLADGTEIDCDLVITGIGISPNVALAENAGLDVAVGLLVDDHARTSDPAIYGCGDCTIFPFNHMPTRLESVQNANDQAAIVAANIMGANEAYIPLPWFWSDQYHVKLQIAGLNRGYNTVVSRAGKREGSVAHFYFAGDKFLAVDCLNDGATYLMSRKILAENRKLTPQMAADPGFDLRGFAK